MKKLLVLYVFIVFVSSSFAEDDRPVATITIGGSGSESTTYNAKHINDNGDSVEISLDTEVRFGFDVSVQAFFNDYIGLGVDYQHNRGTGEAKFRWPLYGNDYAIDVYTTSIAFFALCRYPLGRNADIFGGIGAARVDVTMKSSNAQFIDNGYGRDIAMDSYDSGKSSVSLAAKIGVNIYIENMVVGVMLKYVHAEIGIEDMDKKADVGGLAGGVYMGLVF